MSNTPHTLGEEFPGQLEAIHALKAKNARFAQILEEYDSVRTGKPGRRDEPAQAASCLEGPHCRGTRRSLTHPSKG